MGDDDVALADMIRQRQEQQQQQQQQVGGMSTQGSPLSTASSQPQIRRDLDWLLHHPSSSHLKLCERLLIKSLLREHCLCRGIPEFLFVHGLLRGKDKAFWAGKCVLGEATGLSPGMAAKV